LKSLVWFGVVGASAAAVHLGVVMLLVEVLMWPALGANVLGFLIAFVVSFLGHHRFSFARQQASAAQALPRFFGVALLGFVCNELLYAALLKAGMGYRSALVLVLVLVAGMTWLLSRFWAFKGRTS